MANTFKIGYLPLSKVNWTNDTLEAARANAIAFLKTLPGVEVMAPDHMLTLEDEAVELREIEHRARAVAFFQSPDLNHRYAPLQ